MGFLFLFYIIIEVPKEKLQTRREVCGSLTK